jgi:protein-tyrosine phosphatase
MAEIVLRAKVADAGLDDRVVVDSAGTGGWHVGSPASSGARRALARRGYATDHTARQFDAAWYPERDLVLALDTSNARDLRRIAPDAESADKVRMLGAFADDAARAAGDDYPGDREEWAVPDPYGLPDEAFEHALDLVERAAEGFVAALRAEPVARGGPIWP